MLFSLVEYGQSHMLNMTDEVLAKLVQKQLAHSLTDEESLILARMSEKALLKIQRQLTELLSTADDAEKIQKLREDIKKSS